jgi:hypothetical protein
MTKFLRLETGGRVNADQIVQITYRGSGALATLRDGSYLKLSANMDEIEKELLPVVAAAPGYTLLQYYAQEDGVEAIITRTSIVAWRIDRDIAIPVTPDNDDDDCSNRIEYGVLLPDGQVIRPWLGACSNEEDWRAVVDQVAKDWQAARRKSKAVKEEPV